MVDDRIGRVVDYLVSNRTLFNGKYLTALSLDLESSKDKVVESLVTGAVEILGRNLIREEIQVLKGEKLSFDGLLSLVLLDGKFF